MTGFGKAEGTHAHKKITVEIKSLNSKQFDLTVKMPSPYREKELGLRALLSEKLSRGKIDLNIYVEASETEKKVSINQSLALLYLDEIRSLTEKAGLTEKEDVLKTLLSMPDVLQSEKAEFDEKEWAKVESLISEASDKLCAFRESEGQRLATDIESRIHIIESLRVEVEKHLQPRLEAVRERIEKNIADLAGTDQGDKNRLEQEIIYYLEKLDITEEEIRLKGHCKYFLETMRADGMVGKKLGFITQEIGREINTMGSKANYVEIQRLVVQMKDELEKIKEQLLNIC
jgi:uncharacterized protein (TIGR00255 family)